MKGYIKWVAAIQELTSDKQQDGTDGATAMQAVTAAPTVGVAPVRRGHWIYTKKHLWYRDENGEVDTWRLDVGFHNGPECRVCHRSICEHCHPDWEDDECERGHYICSECGEASVDGHEHFCSNCGAWTEGGDEDAL